MTQHKMDNRVGAKMRRGMGFFSRKEAALLCELNYWTFCSQITRGAIPRPLHQLLKAYYYSLKDIEEIKETLQKD